jgi:isopropylmalate/homocitrate/citramalate synthase
MDSTVITEIADFFKEKIGYNIPPMTPFVGANFNVTKAGIHADGLLKDEEIYNIFNTKKLLNRKATVAIGKASGLAGIAYWINDNYGLEGDKRVDKKSPLVTALKDWIDEEYEQGRQSTISAMEIERKIKEFSGGQFLGTEA